MEQFLQSDKAERILYSKSGASLTGVRSKKNEILLLLQSNFEWLIYHPDTVNILSIRYSR